MAIAISFGGWLGWHQWRNWRHQTWLNKLPPVERIYQQMLARLSSQGISKHSAQTPLEYAQNVRDTQTSAIGISVLEISQAYTAWRYGQQPQQLDRLQELLQDLPKSSK
jgi:protein-glutamine gamma-glutamyltransferase